LKCGTKEINQTVDIYGGIMRNLATIQIIENEFPIHGKDRIVLATMKNLGWQVIVQKDQIRIGDKVVYIEIDSVLPDREEFNFLKDHRIKTMKMAGVRSEGICFPMSILTNSNYDVGQDVTDDLGIKQYEKTMDIERENTSAKTNKRYPRFLMRSKLFRKLILSKKLQKGFPEFVNKTDETRVQNAPFFLDLDMKWVETEKIDGQSGTFALYRHKSKIPFVKDKFEYIVCSRNLRIFKKDNSTYWNVSDRYDIKNALMKIIGRQDWVAIQGECIAPGVQGNKYHVDTPDLYVFNVIYPCGRLPSSDAKESIESLGMKFVPIVNSNTELPKTVDDILDHVTHNSQLHNTLREGSVFRSVDGKLSFKAVSPKFLMKHNE